MKKLRHRLWLGMLLLGVSVLTAHAQSANPDQEYQKLIQVDQEIHPLGEHPFGENISLYCWRSFKTDQLCSLKIDQGKKAEGRSLGCG